MSNLTVNTTSDFRSRDSLYVVYAPVMAIILAVGLVGNILTIIVFSQKQHRTKSIAPFIINLAIADLNTELKASLRSSSTSLLLIYS